MYLKPPIFNSSAKSNRIIFLTVRKYIFTLPLLFFYFKSHFFHYSAWLFGRRRGETAGAKKLVVHLFELVYGNFSNRNRVIVVNVKRFS